MLANTSAFLIRISDKPNATCPKAIILNKTETTIGRRGDVKMDTTKKKEVSKLHACIHRHIKYFDCYFTIDDLHSVNGTFINGQKIIRDELFHKDEVVFAGGNQYLVGDFLQNRQDLECVYRFILPEIEVDFSKCKDFNDEFSTDTENEECCVCFSHSHKLIQLICGHYVCVSCLSKWSMSCFERLHTFRCPYCRHKLPKMDFGKDSAEMVNGIQIVYSIEPLLKTLNVARSDEVVKLSIRKRWTLQNRESFWSFNQKVSDSHNLRFSFHWLTECTLQQVLLFNEEELKNVICNLEGNIKNTHGKLLEEAVYLIATKIMNLDK
ncbi:hypothetical protein TVAG_274160 [Trichomonas vaginalis G3]|uniref:E3 ubiquitin-protein ligase CHFR n=1 Tax=Trichomonas vaginalis (strain ATCC PRA-98 / G3) TaxID=412133 RepID=A2G8K6_TRIV3|nr:SMAD/FHA domain family [Trichomonas vaginalis G3]EAX86516.1 hypothetical protein TVAG_274160 [Trichomonas vaginalis G3]KAI5489577.1 SMAD/FHA domain family [Trichomonas vaginalis G3]|eukprot:XP_001299446.1 hypothetical protein [Trichomonas vaginalis G3]